MELFSLFFGLFIIGLGFFIKKFPNTISGYSTMSAQKKKNVDIQSIATIHKKGFIIIGIITIVGAQFSSWFELNIAFSISIFAPLLIGVFILTLMSQKYDHNKQSKLKKNVPIIIISIVLIIVVISLSYGSIPTKIEISDNNITFTGNYGITIQNTQIEEVKLLEAIPRIKMRTNGLSFGNTRKGLFRLEEFGKCRLFLELPNPPYLYIKLNNGNKVLFNSADSIYTKKKYREILEHKAYELP